MDIFSNHTTDIGKTDLAQMMLIPRQYQTLRPNIVHIVPYISCLAKGRIDLEKGGIMFPSTSSFTSPVIIVPKKKDLSTCEITYRLLVNFRVINEHLEYWSYPLLRIDRIFSKVHRPKLFCTLDGRLGYYNITMDEDSRKYTASTNEYGKYEFLPCPI